MVDCIVVQRETSWGGETGYSAVGSALAWGARGRGFKSRYPDSPPQPTGANPTTPTEKRMLNTTRLICPY